MKALITSIWPIFFGLTLIMIGNGLQGTLLGVRASIEEFTTFSTGLIMSCYFFGFVAGSMIAPKLIQNVGHIRVFAAMASLASTTVLLHGLFIDPVLWALVRVFTGFSYAGLYIVIESWLNDSATNKTRGRILGFYMILSYGGLASGQILLNLSPPTEYHLFVLTSVLVSLALLPISLSRRKAPEIKIPRRIPIIYLYKKSPLGVMGIAFSGMVASILFSIGPVYATESGFSIPQITYLMIAIITGGVAFQGPVGWLSDHYDRRKILIIVLLFCSIAATVCSLAAPLGPTIWIFAAAFLCGGGTLCIYALALAHTNDHLNREQFTNASAALVLTNGLGACFGPLLISLIMYNFGTEMFFPTIAALSMAVFVFGLYRLTRSDPVPLEDQGPAIATPIRSTAPMTASWLKEMDRQAEKIANDP